MEKRSKEKQLRYLAQSIRLKEAASPRLVRMTILVTSFSILGFLGWAGITNVHEIAHAPGEIVPSGFVQVVQHFDGGIVKDIAVREGMEVQTGQVILRLDGAGIEEDLKRAKSRDSLLAMQEERLRAFLENRDLSFKEAPAASAHQEKDQKNFFSTMLSAKEKESAVIRDQIDQKKQAIRALNSELKTARDNLEVTQDLYARRQELQRRGYMADMKLLETEQSYNQAKGQVNNLYNKIAAAKSAVAEYESRLDSLSAGNKNNASQQLSAVIAERVEIAEMIDKLQKQVARLDIRAPVKGIMKALNVNTIGSVVMPGQKLAEIVPTDAPLVVDLMIQPRYIGHLKPGQDVQVKFSTYDFSRYGAVPGRLEFISAATFGDNQVDRYYKGRVTLKRSYVGADPKNNIKPGMTVMADVITGEKTVLAYLLKPVRNAVSTAFTER